MLVEPESPFLPLEPEGAGEPVLAQQVRYVRDGQPAELQAFSFPTTHHALDLARGGLSYSISSV
jgi:hypothetical protein